MVCINQVRQDKSSFRKILSVCEQTIPQSLLPTWKKKKKVCFYKCLLATARTGIGRVPCTSLAHNDHRSPSLSVRAAPWECTSKGDERLYWVQLGWS